MSSKDGISFILYKVKCRCTQCKIIFERKKCMSKLGCIRIKLQSLFGQSWLKFFFEKLTIFDKTCTILDYAMVKDVIQFLPTATI